MKRATLARSLSEVVKRVITSHLPISVLKVFVHGSYFRGKQSPGDLDLVMLVEVKDEWCKHYDAFRTLSDFRDDLWKCYEQGLSFFEATNSILASEVKKKELQIKWLSSVTWKDIFWSLVPFCLDWSKISRQMLTEGRKGVHIEFVTSITTFNHKLGRIYTYQEMPAFLVWSSESPGTFVQEPTNEEFETYLQLENNRLLEDLDDAKFISDCGQIVLEQLLSQIPAEKRAIVALRVIANTAQCDAKEEQLREQLRKFGLPESAVITMKRRGSRTWHHLADTEEEKRDLEERAQNYDKVNAVERELLKVFKKYITKNQAIDVNCTIRNLEKGWVEISFRKPPAVAEEAFTKTWKALGFEVEKIYGARVFAETELTVPLCTAKDFETSLKILLGVKQ